MIRFNRHWGLGNNRWEWAKFNERLQVTELNLGSGVLDASLWKLTYHYGELNSDGRTVDAAKNTGNIAMQTVSFAGLTEPFVQTYRYDSLYRITEARETNGAATNASQNWEETFGYDRYGNRTNYAKFSGATQLVLDNKTFPSIDPATNRFNPNQGFQYDKNGNLIADAEGRSFVFNGENKQAKIIKDGKLVGEYDYNGEGQRVRKRTYDANGALQDTTVFVYSAGKLVAEYSTAAPPENPTTRYTATDMLGSPRVITDSEGNVIARRDFKPFGEEVTNNTGERTTTAKYGISDNLRQKFTTYQRDEETGLDFAEARMYENRHGRFTAVDPLLASGKSANPQTFNRFVYVLNNPIILMDPCGLQVSKKLAPSRVLDIYIIANEHDDPNIAKPYRDLKKEAKGSGWTINVRYYNNSLGGNDLARSLGTQGRTVIIVTHATDNPNRPSDQGILVGKKISRKMTIRQVFGSYGFTTNVTGPRTDTYTDRSLPRVNAENTFVVSCHPGDYFPFIITPTLSDGSTFYSTQAKNAPGTIMASTADRAALEIFRSLTLEGESAEKAVADANKLLVEDSKRSDAQLTDVRKATMMDPEFEEPKQPVEVKKNDEEE